jgi:hypothetical protein
MRPAVGIDRRQPSHTRRRQPRIVHFGVILPNYGKDSTPDGIRRVAELA